MLVLGFPRASGDRPKARPMNSRLSLTKPLRHLGCSRLTQKTAKIRLKTSATCGPAMCAPSTSGRACKRSGAWAVWGAGPGLTITALPPICAMSAGSGQHGVGARSGSACRQWRSPQSMSGLRSGSEVEISQSATRREQSTRATPGVKRQYAEQRGPTPPTAGSQSRQMSARRRCFEARSTWIEVSTI